MMTEIMKMMAADEDSSIDSQANTEANSDELINSQKSDASQYSAKHYETLEFPKEMTKPEYAFLVKFYDAVEKGNLDYVKLNISNIRMKGVDGCKSLILADEIKNEEKKEKMITFLKDNGADRRDLEIENILEEQSISHEDFYKFFRSGYINLNSKIFLNFKTRNKDCFNNLRKALDEITTKNIYIKDEINFHINKILVEYFYENPFYYAKIENEEIKLRKDVLKTLVKLLKDELKIEQVELLKDEPKIDSDESVHSEKFFFFITMILKDLHILERILENIQDLEELDLSKENKLEQILKYIQDLEELDLSKENKLEQILKYIQDLVESDSNTKDKLKQILEYIQDLIESDSNTEDKLEQILKYIQAKKNKKHNIYSIKRMLQTIGEYMKSTKETPNLSNEVLSILKLSTSLLFQSGITKLRDIITHPKTPKIDEMTKEIFNRVIRYIKEIYNQLLEILFKKRNDVIEIFFLKVIKCEDLKELKSLYNIIKNEYFYDINEDIIPKMQPIKSVWDKFKSLNSETNNNKYINKIDKILQDLDHFRPHYKLYKVNLSNFQHLKCIIRTSDDFLKIKIFCIQNLNIFNHNRIYVKHDLSFYQPLECNIKILIESYKLKIEISEELNNLEDMLIYINLNQNNVKTINELQLTLDFQSLEEIISEIKIILDYIKDKLKNTTSFDMISKLIESQIQIYDGKNKLLIFIANDVYSDNHYKNLMEIITKYNIPGLDQLPTQFKTSKNEAVQIVEKIPSIFGDLINNFRPFMEKPFDFKKFKKTFETFFTSIISYKDEESKIIIKEKLEEILLKYHNEKLKEKLNKFKLDLKEYLPKGLEKIKEYSKNKSHQFTIEMILLEMLEILFNNPSNSMFLDDYSPFLIGRNLRNYLAHGNVTFDVLTINIKNTILSTAIAFENMDTDKLLNFEKNGPEEKNLKKESEKNQNCEHDDFSEIYQTKLSWIAEQNKLFQCVKKNNLAELEKCLSNGGSDLKGFNSKGRSVLNFAIDGNCKNFILYILNNFYPNINVSIDVKHFYNYLIGDIEYKFTTEKNINFNRDKLLKMMDIFYSCHSKYLPWNLIIYYLFYLAIEYEYIDIIEVMLSNDEIKNTLLPYFKILYMKILDKGNTKILECCLKFNIQMFDIIDQSKITLMHLAVFSNNIENVKILCKIKNIHHNARDVFEKSPLNFAAKFGYLDIVKELINSSQININDNCDAMLEAIFYGNVKIVNLFLENKFDIHLKHKEITVLQQAVAATNYKLIHYSINNKVDLNCITNLNVDNLLSGTPSKTLKILNVLHQSGVDVNCKLKGNTTALHSACRLGNLEIVEELLKNYIKIKEDINAEEDYLNYTPIKYAIKGGHRKIVEYLINAGAKLKDLLEFVIENGNVKNENENERENENENKNVKNKNENVKNKKLDLIKYLIKKGAHLPGNLDDKNVIKNLIKLNEKDNKILNYLIEKEVIDITKKFDKGLTAVHMAVSIGSTAFIDTLVEKGLVLNSGHEKNKLNLNSEHDGKTPLFIAVEGSDKKMIKHLIENGADINYKTETKKETCLHFAIRFSSVEIVKVILDYGGNIVNMEDDIGNTPLHYAVIKNKCNFVEVLLKHGANSEVCNIINETPLDIAKKYNYTKIIELIQKSEVCKDVVERQISLEQTLQKEEKIKKSFFDQKLRNQKKTSY